MTPIQALLMSALLTIAMPGMAVERQTADMSAQTRTLYLQLIHQARADGRPRAAIAYLDDFDRQFPGDLDARILRANSLLDLGQVDAADSVLTGLPTSNAGASLSAARGHVLSARGQWAAAAPLYQAAVTASPTDPMLRNALGYALLRCGQANRAVEQLRGAADLAPRDDVIRNNLILALTMNGQKTDADAAIGRITDRKAQTDLRRQIDAEAVRLSAIATMPASAKKAS